ncbi:MAG: hypothetical protein NZ602_08605 [Thermoguttaceae bacterium]|nr:hypothetical protein [Thermoguttaceae bacterium]MDW8037351.1 hypothetical protein [Thermoguttaceae bacterium]
MSRSTHLKGVVLLGGVLLLVGCVEQNSGCIPVGGKITYKGQALSKGSVSFVPPSGQGQPAIGTIQSDGTYQMITPGRGPGVLPGQYNVAIQSSEGAVNLDRFAPQDLANTVPKGSPPGVSSGMRSLIPLRYTDVRQSGLSVTIPADAKGPLRFDFNLND